MKQVLVLRADGGRIVGFRSYGSGIPAPNQPQHPLRYAGWSETWGTIVRLGLPNEPLRIPQLADRTYAEVVEMFLPLNVRCAPLEQRVATFLRISPTGGMSPISGSKRR